MKRATSLLAEVRERAKVNGAVVPDDEIRAAIVAVFEAEVSGRRIEGLDAWEELVIQRAAQLLKLHR